MDEDQHFFQSLLSSVRKLDHVSKIDFKMKVLATLKELLTTQSTPNPQNAQTSAFQYVATAVTRPPSYVCTQSSLHIPLNTAKYLIHQLLLWFLTSHQHHSFHPECTSQPGPIQPLKQNRRQTPLAINFPLSVKVLQHYCRHHHPKGGILPSLPISG